MRTKAVDILLMAVAIFIAAVLLFGGLAGLVAGFKAFGRYQTRADNNQNRQQRLYNEQNLVKVNDIRISQTRQLVQVARQQAAIRVQNAIGLRNAQDEIAKTLTPLYIQFEAIQAQLAMAKSHNHTLVWVPSGANGVPLVSTINPSQVAAP